MSDPADLDPAARAALAVDFSDAELADVLTLSPLPPPPPDPTNAWADSPQAAALGHWLFYDTALSADGTVSCATCHPTEHALSDGRALARGLADLPRNAPALWNVGHNRWFFWDGRVDSLWAQALGPLEDSREHGTDRMAVVRQLAARPELSRAYARVFGPLPDLSDPTRFPEHARPGPEDADDDARRAWLAMAPDDRERVTEAFVHVGKAIAAHVRRLRSADAPFDRFAAALRAGDARGVAAYDAAAQRGLRFFLGEGRCLVCHFGPEFTDREFHDVRVPPRPELPEDTGRQAGLRRLLANEFLGTGRWSDDCDAGETKVGFLDTSGHVGAGQFKTPTLRNVAVTGPYMHQGQFATLRDVLRHYSTFAGAPESVHPEVILRPLHLTEAQADDLVAFLESLTDTALDPALLAPPPSPFPP